MAKKNAFNSVQLKKLNGSTFDLSHDVKQSMKFGILYPTLQMDCVPGDRIRIGCDALMRFLPMVAPIMHRIDVYMHYYFVPYRLLWPNWENFITQTEVAGNVPAHPYFDIGVGNMNTTLHQYFGIPSPGNAGASGTERVSAFPWAAYQMIYNEYYRDQDIIDPVIFQLGDGSNSYSSFRDFRRRAWEHDYFTSARPEAQKGDPVSMPVNIMEDVAVFKNDTDFPNSEWDDQNTERVVVDNDASTNPSIGQDYLFVPKESYEANTLVSDFRRAMALQRWLERNQVAGTRYIEFILAHFGVRSSDKRLQRPEYIAGSKAPVNISEVLNTTGTTELPQGNMAGHAVAVSQGGYGGYYCEEHGMIMGICSVMPKPAYMQGIPRNLLKYTNTWEYFTAEFEHIGEQAIKNKELYAFDGATGEEDFGYTPRYAEYKYMPNRVAGEMMDTLKFWTLAMDFAANPGLSQAFIDCDPRVDIFADAETDYIIGHIYHKIKASRLMSYYSTPI